MQTTTTVSADVPAQTQHITKGRSLWIEEATRIHDADDHYCFRGHPNKNAEVYGSGKRHGSTMQTTTAVSLTCQHRHNISRRVEVYGSRKQRRSMTQTTTTVSTGIPARMQKSMDRGSDTAPRCRRPLQFPLTCQHRRNISRRVEVYGLRKRRGSMTQTTTTVSAGIPARMQKSMDWGSDTTSRFRRPLQFPLTCQHRRNISRRVEVYGSRKRRGSMTQTTTTVSAGMSARMQKSMHRRSDMAPQCSLVGRRLPFLAEHDDLANHCVVLAARYPSDVRFHHEAVKRQHFFLRESMHVLPLVTVHVLDMVR